MYLREKMNIFATGTFRKNRINHCLLKDDKILEKEERGSTDFKTIDKKFLMIKFLDNKPVHIGSTQHGIEPMKSLLRYSKEEKKKSQRAMFRRC